MHELQERVNCMNDFGEFQGIESNHSEKILTFPVNRQSLENVFANPRSTFESLQILYQGTHPFMAPKAAREAPALISSGRLVAREEERIGSTIQMPTFARRPPTMSSFIPLDHPQSSMVGQQRQQISELQFGKYPTPQSNLCWKIRFRYQATTCSDFPRRQCYGSKR